MERYNTHAERDALLKLAIGLPGGRSVKEIAAASAIKVNTLYKWKTTPAHLSPAKADALLLYFIENEPKRLELAETVLAAERS